MIGGHDRFTASGDALLWAERDRWRRVLFVTLGTLGHAAWFGRRTWQIAQD